MHSTVFGEIPRPAGESAVHRDDAYDVNFNPIVFQDDNRAAYGDVIRRTGTGDDPATAVPTVCPEPLLQPVMFSTVTLTLP